MKIHLGFLTVLALLACGQAAALPADHPANPEAMAPAFRPTDYFAGQSGNVKLAADEHRHDAAPTAQESGAKEDAAAHEHKEGEGKGRKRGEGMGCCCKCCCMDGGGMKMHGDAGMQGCPMMQKGMQQEGGEVVPETKKEEGHESHH